MSDREKQAGIATFSWSGVTVPRRKPSEGSDILVENTGFVEHGEMLALVGPSGSGKSTLLKILARRSMGIKYPEKCQLQVDSVKAETSYLRGISGYTDQDDSLVGSLTVRETLDFAAQLSLPEMSHSSTRREKVQDMIEQFGLIEQADMLIGTPIQKGISGGQKRRVGIAAQLITQRSLYFFDEPTSGLDSAAALNVMQHLKHATTSLNIIVIAAIHQPSSEIINLFSRLMVLTKGITVYQGSIAGVEPYFNAIALKYPSEQPKIQPAGPPTLDGVMSYINTDFCKSEEADNRIKILRAEWLSRSSLWNRAEPTSATIGGSHDWSLIRPAPTLAIMTALAHRSFIKSYRDFVAYSIRITMYLALAILMGTVWLRLQPVEASIQPLTNAIFFGGAFLSFMAVAYIPAYLEDYALLVKERANGLYGPAPFMLVNFCTSLPYLFIIATLFSTIVYWLSNFRPSAGAFTTWIMWLFLDLVAAESLVVMISSILPVFVIALAVTAFANGLWMCTGGFLVPEQTLNPFWRYLFHYIDYQSYVFKGMVTNEFRDRNFTCTMDSTAPNGCFCSYHTELADQCLVAGSGVLKTYGYNVDGFGSWVGAIIGIICFYRIVGWIVLHFKTRK